MIEGLKPYPEYKDIDIPSFGSVPKDWKTLRAKCCYREVDERSKSGREVLCSVSHKTGVTPRKSNVTMFMAESTVGYKICRPNDLVINTLWAWMAALGIARQVGIVSPAYGVYRPLANSLLSPSYADRLLRTPQYIREYMARSTGVNASRLRLYPEQFLCIPILIPPPDEQAAIVKFLDHANAKIERAIRAKRKLIGLLNEQKQAIIHRAVTRGLDPNVKLKPSGIPWLGDVPEHWEIVRNMAIFSHRVEPGIADLPVLQVSLRSGITAEGLDQFGRPKRLIADAKKYKRIYKGDMAYNTMRMWQGAVGVSPVEGLVSPAYVVLKPRKDTCAEFYDLLFHTDVYKQQVNRQSTGIVSDRNRLYWDSFKLMPNLAINATEQNQIVTFVTKETAAITTGIARNEREIDLLREYRTTLIAEVVTGKLDVREAAKRLPDKAVETLPPDDSMDEMIEDEIQEEDDA